MVVARHKDVCALIEESLLNLLVGRRVDSSGVLCVLFCGCCGVSAIVGSLEGWRGDPSEVWSLIRLHVSLGASVSKTFCNYSIGIILHS